MSLDRTTLDVGDTTANAAAFGRPASARGVKATGACPKLRLVGLLENGAQVITGAQLGAYGTSERVLAVDVLAALTGAMLCLADRGLLSLELWRTATATGAALVWRVPASVTSPVLERYVDCSYRSELRWNAACTSRDRAAQRVRVVQFTVAGGPTPSTRYRLVTSILEPARAPADKLAALYHERWEMETAFDELKTQLRARDPDTVSFTQTINVTRRTLSHVAALPPSGRAAPAPRAAPRTGRHSARRGELEPPPRRASRRQTEDE